MGGVVGGVVFLLVVTLLILLVVCLLQKKKQRKYEMAAGMQCVACNYVPAHMTSYDIICVRFLCQW